MFRAIAQFSPYFWYSIKAEWLQKENFSFTRDILQAPLIKKLPFFLQPTTVWQ